jgi:hypothetical protein
MSKKVLVSDSYVSAGNIVTEDKVQYPMTDGDEKVKWISIFQLLEFGRGRESYME